MCIWILRIKVVKEVCGFRHILAFAPAGFSCANKQLQTYLGEAT